VLARAVLIWASAAALASFFVSDALAVKVHVRVEGRTRTIFGATEPLIDVTSPRANPLPENALDALESAGALGEFYYHVSFLPTFRVDQIGRYAAVGQTAWAYKVNGIVPMVPANEYRLKQGDRVLWYFAQLGIVPGGPKTLVLTRLPRSKCYRVQAQDDRGTLTAAIGAVLHVGKRRVKTQGATQFALACVGPHRGSLVRATLAGAIRSNALR
jgi:Domain of unknown function (DUF4430)